MPGMLLLLLLEPTFTVGGCCPAGPEPAPLPLPLPALLLLLPTRLEGGGGRRPGLGCAVEYSWWAWAAGEVIRCMQGASEAGVRGLIGSLQQGWLLSTLVAHDKRWRCRVLAQRLPRRRCSTQDHRQPQARRRSPNNPLLFSTLTHRQ